MSNPFEPNTTYYQDRYYVFDGGCYGQDTTRDYLRVCKTTPHTITTSDGKRYKVCCDEYGKYVKVGFTRFSAKSVKKEHPNKNKKADISDETLKRFAKYFKKVRARGVSLLNNNIYDVLNDLIRNGWRWSDDDITLDEYLEKTCARGEKIFLA